MPVNNEIERNNIPFLIPDLPESQEVLPFLRKIDENRWYSNFGPLLHSFEEGLCNAFFPELSVADERLVACSSGTSAIELALLSLNLPKNAKVLIPSFTFAATATAVIRAGYRPIFTDVDPGSWLLTPDIAKQVLNFLTVDAIIPVAALGVPQDAAAWDAFAKETGIPVVIDAAAALGHQRIGQNITVCFSLHATKAFGIGEGGLIVTSSSSSAASIRKLSNFGFSNFVIAQAGSNYKLSEYHAAVGLAQLQRLKTIFRRRESVRQAYREKIDQFTQWGSFQVVSHDNWPAVSKVTGLQHYGFHSVAAIRLKDSVAMHVDELVQVLDAFGIGVRRWYAPALHMQPAFSQFDCINASGNESLRVTEDLIAKLIGLPFHNHLSGKDIHYICTVFCKTLSAGQLGFQNML